MFILIPMLIIYLNNKLGQSQSSTNNESSDNHSNAACLHTFQNHNKNITSLCLDATHTRLLTSGLDGNIKIYNLSLMTYVFGIKCSAPVMTVGMSCDNKKIVIGYVDGNLEIKNKKDGTSYSPIGEPTNSTTINNRNNELRKVMLAATTKTKGTSQQASDLATDSTDLPSTDIETELATVDVYKNPMEMIQQQHHVEYLMNQQNASSSRNIDISSSSLLSNAWYKGAGLSAPVLTDHTIETERSAKLKNYEKYLKTFQYAQSLDAALRSKNPLIVLTVLEELARRNGLFIALSSRDETSLEPVLSFIIRYINQPRYSKLLINVTHIVLDIYASVMGYSEAVDELFIKLKNFVYSEISLQKQLLKCMNMLDAIINSSVISGGSVSS